MSRPDDYATRAGRYAERVARGDIPACKWVRFACQRHLDDLERDRAGWTYRFDAGRANHICEFIEELPHVKGKWKSQNIMLEDWQCFILAVVFGWIVRGTDPPMRRFRKALVVVPRKNGKSPLAAGVGLYLLALDDEPGAEVYSAATTRDQAKICWGEYAHKMVKRMPDFCAELGIEPLAHSITVENTGSFFKPLSRDADTLEGLNVHGAIIDELHAHKTREVFDVLDDATGARRQPLLFIISTEGDDSEGVFPEQVDYAQQVLDSRHEDDSYFGIIYTIDIADDWTHHDSWVKANPNLGVSVFEVDMRTRFRQALVNADSQASFLTKRLNVRVGAAHGFFNMLAWDNVCKVAGLDIENFFGEMCVFMLDLASKRDLTTRIAVFRKGGTYYVFGKHYLPGDAVAPGMPNYDFYRGWTEKNCLTVTEGNITDYDFVERDLLADVQQFKPAEVGIDPNYNAAQFSTRMIAAGVPIIDVPHNVMNFSDPMKQLDALIVAGRIKHNGDPVLTWAMGNVVARTDAKGNVYPRKAREVSKIDPAVALIGAMSRHLRQGPQDISVYANPQTAVM